MHDPPDHLPALDGAPIVTVLCDLDGVVWLDHQPISGSVEAITALRASGRRVVFVTNNSAARVDEHVAALARIGVDATGDVVSAAMAAARLVEPGEVVLVCGGEGIAEAVAARGAHVVRNDGTPPREAIDVVVVGLDRQFDYRRLTVAANALHRGARLVGTNADSTYPTPRGLEPGGGAILAAIAAAADLDPVIAGKPHAPMAALLTELVAPDGAFVPEATLVVGDRAETDGLMAARLGCPFALVRTGVTSPAAPLPAVRVALDAVDLAAVVSHLGST